MTKSNFEEKRARRVERLRELSEKNKTQASSLYNQARQMSSVIPFGQPILVGHHSENSDRNYRISNGLILVPEQNTNDSFYEDRDSIEAHGLGMDSGESVS